MLDSFAENMWIAEGQCVNFHGFPYSTRSVVICLSNGDIWIWSPIQFDDALAREIEALGPVRHLVSPNKIHHLFLSEWHERFPQAVLWGPQSTRLKRTDLTFEAALTGNSPDVWSHEIEQFHVTGSFAMDEILFYHFASKTLIVADFSENFSEAFLHANWSKWQRWLAKIAGVVEGKGFAPLDWRSSFLKRRAVRELKKELLATDIEKVVMAHGVLQHSNGNSFLKRSLSWI